MVTVVAPAYCRWMTATKQISLPKLNQRYLCCWDVLPLTGEWRRSLCAGTSVRGFSVSWACGGRVMFKYNQEIDSIIDHSIIRRWSGLLGRWVYHLISDFRFPIDPTRCSRWITTCHRWVTGKVGSKLLIWGLPKIVVPPVIIHNNRWIFFLINHPAIGYPHLWKPPYKLLVNGMT